MDGVEIWALAGALGSGAATAWARTASKKRGPSRGFGGVYAALFLFGAWSVVVLHGTAAAVAALATGRTAWGAGALAAHLLLAAAPFRR